MESAGIHLVNYQSFKYRQGHFCRSWPQFSLLLAYKKPGGKNDFISGFVKIQDGKEEEITPDSNVSIDNNTPKKTNLKYLSGDRKDTGEYTVTVANKHGSDDANIEVVVLGKLVG